jgi:predicted nucleotide-binding protein
LFTKDDDRDLPEGSVEDRSAPRDNVVFEASYFSGIKGKRNVLIVRETGSKMPADLGGDIYASLPNKDNISPIEGAIESFLGEI